MISAADFARELHLKPLVTSSKTRWNINSSDLNRPGMQFCGFYEHFAFERPQIIGKVEMSYLESLEPAQRETMLERYFAYDLPCVVICRGMQPPEDLLAAARRHDVAVYITDIQTTRFIFNAANYLNERLAPRVTRHGVLVDVYGMGVLITGDSGVGKSEAALELVRRGHQLVADDVVEIIRLNESTLIGECPEMVRHLMEIRGIGIIDIRAMYGVGSVESRKEIDLVMHMERWQAEKEYDRLGLTDDHDTILGVSIPKQILPVLPGRNVAIVVEVAARNLSLHKMGYNAARELDRRLNELIQNPDTEQL